jgi:AmmeMemoRadiSam system protein B/AmmeMemoRadiSam system protein A
MTPLPTPIRLAAVAGAFYPDSPPDLRAAVARHLAAAGALADTGAVRPPKVLVVPHAGFVYSGDIAALGYAPLAAWRGHIRRVVLLGPAHRVALKGLAAPTVRAFETPLGSVPVDQQALSLLSDLPQVLRSDLVHAQEHALEVQLPFLQTVLGEDFGLVPLAVGRASPAEVAEVLERLWGGDETLVVVSTDLSHYLPCAEARARDRATVQRILSLATDLRGDEACGAAPLNGALRAARQYRLRPRLLGLRNSADVAGAARGGLDRVVGYAALAFEHASPGAQDDADDPEADTTLGDALVGTARQSIAQALGLPEARGRVLPDHPALRRPGASFVTLHDAGGRLRGCVGRLEATRALGEDVRANALAAAFEDRRFMPLRSHEWAELQVEVSVLEAAEPLRARSEDEALAALRPGIDGVILEWRGRRATLLPQVWRQLPDAGAFMAALKTKAGLVADFWAGDLRLSRYRVRCFADCAAPGAWA